MINRVLPAIKSKFPRGHNNNIIIGIQHDNAPTHFGPDDESWQTAVNNEGNWRFQLKEQPANSPDTNILDLGFFSLIQLLQWQQQSPSNINGLIATVLRAWEIYTPRTLERIWISHQAVCNEIIQCNGDNDYQMPHIHKCNMVNNNGNLPLSIDVSKEAEDALSDMDLHDVFFDSDDEEFYN
jgi:hypothetical protein